MLRTITHTHTHTHIYIYIHTYIYIHIYTYIHTNKVIISWRVLTCWRILIFKSLCLGILTSKIPHFIEFLPHRVLTSQSSYLTEFLPHRVLTSWSMERICFCCSSLTIASRARASSKAATSRNSSKLSQDNTTHQCTPNTLHHTTAR